MPSESMLEKLKTIEDKFEEIGQKLCDPEIVSDIDTYTALLREHKKLEPVVEKFREYSAALKNAQEAKEIAEDGGQDRELRELARVLYRMYSMYAERRGFKTELLSANETQLGGYKEISFMIEGDGAYSRFKFESGVHRVQRVPETESQGRIHTSTVTVAVLPEAQEVDVQIDTYRSSGAGGQHVNKTESAIRITHIPTGTVVECQDERSQHKNREKAMKILRSHIYEMEMARQNSEIAGERRAQVGTGDRSERIRTYNYPQTRVTDHRIGLTLYKLDAILNGDLDELIDALITADTAERLKAEA